MPIQPSNVNRFSAVNKMRRPMPSRIKQVALRPVTIPHTAYAQIKNAKNARTLNLAIVRYINPTKADAYSGTNGFLGSYDELGSLWTSIRDFVVPAAVGAAAYGVYTLASDPIPAATDGTVAASVGSGTPDANAAISNPLSLGPTPASATASVANPAATASSTSGIFSSIVGGITKAGSALVSALTQQVPVTGAAAGKPIVSATGQVLTPAGAVAGATNPLYAGAIGNPAAAASTPMSDTAKIAIFGGIGLAVLFIVMSGGNNNAPAPARGR